MRDSNLGQMHIYVAGPYSAPADETDPSRRQLILDNNIRKATEVAIEIARRGHVPFVPHTMMQGWDTSYGVERNEIMRVAKKWLERCDALFYMAPSPGTDEEREFATKLQLQVFYNLDDVPLWLR